ncbi:LysR family transcriptional regulator [Leisingera sp. ANG59]|uniref:LysR family transcriptional regulator n=1 Tax=Leisingera sp. ANG59 TaxID=2675221 RepID=UPI001C2D9D80|nr:LysR family transcriptional regulator [Leisingera sp. ANG59]
MGKLDVNALRTLVAIYDRRSFTEAAKLTGVNQSTTSYVVKALRDTFGDALFIRSGHKVVPTERCRELVDGLRPILYGLDGLAARAPFDPSNTSGDIVISCNYHERRAILPDTIRSLLAAAPNLRIQLHEAAVDGKRQLIENTVDIVLGPVSILGDIFYRRHLFTDRYVCVVDRAHPLATVPMTLARFAEARHLAVTHNGQWEAMFYPILRNQGIDIRPVVSVPSHDNISDMLRGTQLLSSIPQRLAGAFSDEFTILPFPIDVPIAIDMYWTERTHHSGPHQWVRQILGQNAQCL